MQTDSFTAIKALSKAVFEMDGNESSQSRRNAEVVLL